MVPSVRLGCTFGSMFKDQLSQSIPENLKLVKKNIQHDSADLLNFRLGGRCGFLTGDLEDMVIFDIINHVGRLYGR